MRVVDDKQVGARISQVLRLKGIEQKELAAKLGVTPKTVGNYQAGQINWKRMDEVAAFLDEPKQWFMYGDEADDADESAVASSFEVTHLLLQRKTLQVARESLELSGQILELLRSGLTIQAR